MRFNHWLIVIIGIILLVNITFFVLIKYVKIDRVIIEYIRKTVEQAMDCDFNMEYYSLSDRQFFATDIELVDKDKLYRIYVEKVQIEFNLWYLIFIKSKPTQLVSAIRIYNPTVDLMILGGDDDEPEPPPSPDKEIDYLVELAKIQYPDTYMFFTRLDVYNGIFNMLIDLPSFFFEKQIQNIDINIVNQAYHTTANIAVRDSTNATLDVEVTKPIGLPPTLHMNLATVEVQDMKIPGIGYVNSNAHMQLEYEEELEMQIMLTDSNMTFTLEELQGVTAQVDTLLISGSESFLTLITFPISIQNDVKYSLNTTQTTLTASIASPLDGKNTEFMTNIRVEDITIPAEIVNPENKVAVNIIGEGNFKSISTRARINADLIQLSLPLSDSLTIKEELSGVQINVTNENVLQNTFNLKLDIEKILGSKLTASAKFDPYLLTGNASLFADDLMYAFRTTQPPPTTLQTARTDTLRADRDRTSTGGQRRGQRGTRTTPRPETSAPTAQIIENFIKASLTSNIDFAIKNNIFTLKPSDLQIKNIDVHYLDYALTGNYINLKTDMQFDTSRPIIQKHRKNPLQINANAEITYNLYNETLQGAVSLDLADWETTFHTTLNRFNLSDVNPKLPAYLINSDISAKYNSTELDFTLSTTAGNLLIKDLFVITDLGLYYHKLEDTLDFKLNIKDSFVNYTPLAMQIEAIGSKASIQSQTFHLNEQIFGDFYVEIPDNIAMFLDDTWIRHIFDHSPLTTTTTHHSPLTTTTTHHLPLNLTTTLWGDDLSINHLAQYAMSYTDAGMLTGKLSFSVNYDNRQKPAEPLSARFTAKDMVFDPLNPFNIDLRCTGDIDRINVENLTVDMDSLQILYATALIKDMGQHINAQADFWADLEDIQNTYDVSGNIAGTVVFIKDKEEATAHVKLDTETIYFQKKPLLRTSLDISQLVDKLQVNNAEVFIGREFVVDTPKKQKRNAPPPTPRAVPPLMYVTLYGGLNYNLITDMLYPVTDSLHIAATGDPIATIQSFTPFISGGSSAFNMNGSVIIVEDGLQFLKGRMELNNGQANVLTQSETVKDIRIITEIVDNVFHLRDFRLSLGKGTLNIRNNITNSAEDIVISNINFGRFLISTDRTGLQVYAPGFMPSGTTAYLIIRGRNAQQASISGPIDDMSISAEVELYNANIIFPEKTDNLLKMFDFVRSEIRSTSNSTTPEPLDLPFTLDLMALLSRNNRYVTYPMDLRLDEDCYAHVTFDGKQFIIQEVSIKAEEGTLELFGTFLDLDSADLMLSRFEDVPNLNALFYKKVADGSSISLKIYTDREGGAKIMDRLKFKFDSDNPDDTIGDILAKLRYGRTFDEMDESGAGLAKDEAIQILGVSVASEFLYQYLAPLENRVRRVLRLDNMNINPGFVQNMVNQKVWEDFALNESSIFNTSLLLNNLQIQMGRYVNRNVFLEYELNFQEGTELTKNTDILLYHTFGVRYDLPFQLKVRYSYEFKPRLEPNAHEVYLMRSFKF